MDNTIQGELRVKTEKGKFLLKGQRQRDRWGDHGGIEVKEKKPTLKITKSRKEILAIE